MIKIISAAVTKTGRRRNNQDNFMLGGRCAECDHDVFSYRCEGKSNTPFFAAVCDGMGGESSGERASYEACREFAGVSAKLTGDFSADKKRICDSILSANTRLCEVMQTEGTGRMGSTVISVLIQGDTLFYTNLGDSRIYLLRDGKLTQITKDHTEGQSMVDAGVLTAEQLKKHPSRNKLNRHLGIFPEEMVLECPAYQDIRLEAGDKLLLSSDGVFGVLEDEQMVSILSEKTTAEERAAKLIDTAYAGGSKDNMTAMVIDVEKAMPAIMPAVYSAAAVGLCVLLAFIIGGALKRRSNTPGRTDATAEPTEAATELPADTEEPTDEPTPAATEPITEVPTAVPTEEPTEEPTETPEATEAPTETPAPTPTPTPTPTETPTNPPTVSPSPTPAPDPVVYFSDPTFEQAFRNKYGYSGAIHESDLPAITALDLPGCGLTNISDIAKFRNLKWLDLSGNNISDISPIAGLIKLTYLNLNSNNISDISPLAGLTNLTELSLNSNNISNISPLAGLTNLTELSLNSNNISDLTPLAALTRLKELRLVGNPIEDDQIEWLQQQLPNCHIYWS